MSFHLYVVFSTWYNTAYRYPWLRVCTQRLPCCKFAFGDGQSRLFQRIGLQSLLLRDTAPRLVTRPCSLYRLPTSIWSLFYHQPPILVAEPVFESGLHISYTYSLHTFHIWYDDVIHLHVTKFAGRVPDWRKTNGLMDSSRSRLTSGTDTAQSWLHIVRT